MPVHGLHELLTWSGAGWLPPVCGREMGGSLVFSCLKVCMSTYPEEESFGSGRRDVRVGKIGWASTESVCASWISAKSRQKQSGPLGYVARMGRPAHGRTGAQNTRCCFAACCARRRRNGLQARQARRDKQALHPPYTDTHYQYKSIDGRICHLCDRNRQGCLLFTHPLCNWRPMVAQTAKRKVGYVSQSSQARSGQVRSNGALRC